MGCQDSELQLFSKAFHDATQGVFQLTLPKGAQGILVTMVGGLVHHAYLERTVSKNLFSLGFMGGR